MQIWVVFLILSSVMGILSGIYGLYHFAIALFGLAKEKKTEAASIQNHSFTAIISARNEESVIADLVRSLKQQRYPADLLKVIVIADNCTDETAAIARNEGAEVFVRNDPEHATKGQALQWLFDRIMVLPEYKTDAFVFFDADNLVDGDFLAAMNRRLCAGAKIVQGYRDIKNPFDSYISASYGIYFYLMTRFFNLARNRIGLSSVIGGTGFMLSYDVVLKHGWNTKNISEDLEYSFKRIADGYYIETVTDAVVYDEQPRDFKTAWRQRVRWSTGNWYNIFTCVPCLWKSRKKRSCKDGIFYLMAIPSVFTGLLGTVFSVAALLCNLNSSLLGLCTWGASLILSVIAMQFVAWFVLLREKKKPLPYIKGILGFPIFLITFTFTAIVGVIHPVKVWKPIRHGVSK